LGLVGATGCSKALESPDGGGGLDTGTISDPAACGCVVSNYTLTMSWDCFCRQFNCSPGMPSCGYGPRGQITTGCGLSELSVETIGGPERWVYDATGTLVGEQLGTDDGQFACPTAPELIGYSVRAGQFPDSCDSAVSCQCNPDGGTCDPTDAGR
jgi:hypothetical protein